MAGVRRGKCGADGCSDLIKCMATLHAICSKPLTICGTCSGMTLRSLWGTSQNTCVMCSVRPVETLG